MRGNFIVVLTAVLAILALMMLWFGREHWQGNTGADKYRLVNRLVIVLDKRGEIWWIDPSNFTRLPLHTADVSWPQGYDNLLARAPKNCLPKKTDYLWHCQNRVNWRFQNQIYSFGSVEEFTVLAKKQAYGINQKTLQNIPSK